MKASLIRILALCGLLLGGLALAPRTEAAPRISPRGGLRSVAPRVVSPRPFTIAPTAVRPADTAPLPPLYSAPLHVGLPDGRKIALYCEGTGSPTVVFEAGAGNSAAIWSRVQPAIARQVRTCSYDRAGYGASDLGPAPRDAAHVVADLKSALTAARITGPYVLVGHSLGGFYMRLFATEHRAEIAGMVLVDPMIDGGHAPLIALAPTYGRYVAAVEAAYERCLRPTARGEMHPGNPIYASCGSPPMHSSQTDPKQAEASLREQAGMGPSSDEVVAREVSFGDLPLIVLSRDHHLDGGQKWPQTERDAYRAAWTTGHRAIAALSSRGVEREIKGADHGIHQSRPEAVIKAIEEVLSEIRRPGAGSATTTSAELSGEGRAPVRER